MKREEIDKRIGMPDVDAEWARFEREVIGKERPKKRLAAAWAAGIGVAAAIALLLVLNKGEEEAASQPVTAQQTEEQPLETQQAEEQRLMAQLTEEQPLVAQLTDKQPLPPHDGKPTPADVAQPESPDRQAKNVPTPPSAEVDKVYDCGEIMPRHPGGDKAVMKFINENLCYPDMALKYGAKGRVIISFVVDSVGLLSDFKVKKCLLKCDTLRLQQEDTERQEEIGRLIVEQMQEEALRVVSLLSQQPRWTPGEQFGRRVSIRMFIAVRFQPTEQMTAASAITAMATEGQTSCQPATPTRACRTLQGRRASHWGVHCRGLRAKKKPATHRGAAWGAVGTNSPV